MTDTVVTQAVLKVCRKCGEKKSVHAFELRGDSGKRRNSCKSCESAYRRDRYQNDEEFAELAKQRAIVNYRSNPVSRKAYIADWRAKNRDKVRQYNRTAYSNARANFMSCIAQTLKTKRLQCAESGIAFAIDAEYVRECFVSQKGLCVLTGRELLWGGEGWPRDRLSIDRLDQESGYVPGNIRLITYQANMARGKFSDVELLAFCEAILATNRGISSSDGVDMATIEATNVVYRGARPILSAENLEI